MVDCIVIIFLVDDSAFIGLILKQVFQVPGSNVTLLIYLEFVEKELRPSEVQGTPTVEASCLSIAHGGFRTRV